MAAAASGRSPPTLARSLQPPAAAVSGSPGPHVAMPAVSAAVPAPKTSPVVQSRPLVQSGAPLPAVAAAATTAADPPADPPLNSLPHVSQAQPPSPLPSAVPLPVDSAFRESPSRAEAAPPPVAAPSSKRAVGRKIGRVLTTAADDNKRFF